MLSLWWEGGCRKWCAIAAAGVGKRAAPTAPPEGLSPCRKPERPEWVVAGEMGDFLAPCFVEIWSVFLRWWLKQSRNQLKVVALT